MRYNTFRMVLCALLISLPAQLFAGRSSLSTGERLISHLLHDANNASLPKLKRTAPVIVTFGIQLVHIEHLFEAEQLLTCKYWVRQSWYNELITWDPSEWDNIEEVSADAGRVWTPDIVLYNNGAPEFSGGVGKYKMRVHMRHDGRHLWIAPATFTSSCRVHTEYFPFDGQACALKFGSWTLNAAHVVLRSDKLTLIGSNYVASTEWDVVDSLTQHHSKCYKHYGDIPFDDLTFTIKISRKGFAYLFYLVFPCLIVIFTTAFSLSLPPESGERIIVIVTNLLCFALFLFLASDLLPSNSEHVPIISVFYIVLMVISSFSIFMACCILTAYHRGRQINPPDVPPLLKTAFEHLYVKIYRTKKADMLSTNEELKLSADVVLTPVLKTALRKMSIVVTRISYNQVETKIVESENTPASDKIAQEEARERKCQNLLLKDIHKELQSLATLEVTRKRREALRNDWEKIGCMLDRFYFWIFLLMVIASIGYMLATGYFAQLEFELLDPDPDHHEHQSEENMNMSGVYYRPCH